MNRSRGFVAFTTLLLALSARTFAQGAPVVPGPATTPGAVPSAMSAELFYQVLIGEMTTRGQDTGAGYSLLLDAARKTRSPQLYQRAVEVALQARAGESALTAARAWQEAFPKAREPHRFMLQILLAMNRFAETGPVLAEELKLIDPSERDAAILSVPRLYQRASNKKAATAIVEQALAGDLASPQTGASAWSAVGRMRLSAADLAGALEAAERGQRLRPAAEGPALLAIELMEAKAVQPAAEAVVRGHLEASQSPRPEIRMAYARVLLDAQRYAEASRQLEAVTTARPDFAEAWLVQGSLLAQDNKPAEAETALRRFLTLSEAPMNDSRPPEERARARAQAFLVLSQLSERRKDYAMANAWLDRIENSQDLVAAQNRRASILARQGNLEGARKILQALPERTPDEARTKVLAEVQLLRDAKRHKAAYDLLAPLVTKSPADHDLAYELAMLAEKSGDYAEMERVLRRIIAAKPDYQAAYNALGYSFAERGVRLPEARQLIVKALELAPGDPFITDSLAWVEFKAGNKAEAIRLLDEAYKGKPDAEIAAHLGEVLWSSGQRDRALSIWREAMLLNAENETLVETLKRLRVKP